jgi:hypothetical protein
MVPYPLIATLIIMMEYRTKINKGCWFADRRILRNHIVKNAYKWPKSLWRSVNPVTGTSGYKRKASVRAGRQAEGLPAEAFLPSSPPGREAVRQVYIRPGLSAYHSWRSSQSLQPVASSCGRSPSRMPRKFSGSPGTTPSPRPPLLPYPYPDGLAEVWIASLREGVERGDAAAFAVTLAGTGASSAVSACRSIRSRPRRARVLGREAFLGPGVCHRGGRAVIDYGFSVLGLHRVHAIHFSRIRHRAG